MELREGRLQFFIITRWLAGVAAVETVERLEPREWVHVALTNDGSQSARGMKIWLDGESVRTRILYNSNSNTGGTDAKSLLRIGGGVFGPQFHGQVDELRFYDRTLWSDEIALLAVPESIEQIAKLPVDQRAAAQQNKLRAWYLEHAASPELGRLATDYATARAARLKFWDSLPTTMVMEDMVTPRPTHVRMRGQYDRLGDKVNSDVPAIFPPLRDDAPRNRLGFARWLVDGRHPLTARVAVNRYWQKFFGVGLVKTVEDFGLRGQPPSHPRLLDWLATEFVRSGWDTKGTLKRIVMSATYRQSSRVTPELRERDPENRWLARGPRLRLPGHVIRDQALAVSGLLVERIGGPSVRPYQPANLWREMSNMVYRQSQGADLYRRSLYTIWKRTVAPPTLALLDAADRETCAVSLKRTNTPLQALALLNEKGFVESARSLGQRMLCEGGDRPVQFAFRLVTARLPKRAELSLLRNAYNEYLVEYRRAPEEANRLIAIGQSTANKQCDPVELAACTMLANVLLNLDEVISKE